MKQTQPDRRWLWNNPCGFVRAGGTNGRDSVEHIDHRERGYTMKRMVMAAVLLAGGLFLMALPGVAKEVTSGGTAGTTACSPVQSLTAKGDARVGETGTASVQMGWSVAPCQKDQAVTVVASITDWQNRLVVYTDIDAGLKSKLVLSVPARRSYACTVTVFDAATGALLGSSTVYASTTPKGGV